MGTRTSRGILIVLATAAVLVVGLVVVLSIDRSPTDPFIASLQGTWVSEVQHSEIGDLVTTISFKRKSLRVRIDPAPGVQGNRLVDESADYEAHDGKLICSLFSKGQAQSIEIIDGVLVLTVPDGSEQTKLHRR